MNQSFENKEKPRREFEMSTSQNKGNLKKENTNETLPINGKF